ncbi:MAG: hypothetical protein A3G34_16110 [Candidatus Lindowbacteria bacterium RIFCSPLOWO2_12_FULL_62_27]|nr:MAG: hypothetical protein A3I06_12350 [Candidatus Lindowbacteria bacterium RIFCSPLOWO2_02_FULL_62_12]OGH61148.1 MAG: hypothetical protein A3G34_16110 [Candidatus Lindowbacteria bacterium RIFCSPLOWO2_12_FULL_62_27]
MEKAVLTNSISFPSLFDQALRRRKDLFESLHAEGTNAYRLFHGIAEGLPGLTIDRYGSLILLQTFREELSPAEWDAIETTLRENIPGPVVIAYNHRGRPKAAAARSFEGRHRPRPESSADLRCREFGLEYLIRARHRGMDPWLFLDLRAGRRYIRKTVRGLSVLNLFAYTCAAGISAASGGATDVWNVDFASSSLKIGRQNAVLNDIGDDQFRIIEEDCLPVMRQLAGLPPGVRRSLKRKFRKFKPRLFDLVVLDPPAWSKGPFGAVDVARDYPSLFKPAVLAAKPAGGRIMATHHLPSIKIDSWIDMLKRCAAKAGRPIRSVEPIAPESDFPSFDGHHPLKIVVFEV